MNESICHLNIRDMGKGDGGVLLTKVPPQSKMGDAGWEAGEWLVIEDSEDEVRGEGEGCGTPQGKVCQLRREVSPT